MNYAVCISPNTANIELIGINGITDRLGGLVVQPPALSAVGPGFKSSLNHTGKWKTGILVATLPQALSEDTSAGTG